MFIKRVAIMLLASVSAFASNQENGLEDFKGNWTKCYKLPSVRGYIQHRPDTIILGMPGELFKVSDLRLNQFHIDGVKISLTVNTNMSEQEFERALHVAKLYPSQFYHMFADL